MKLPVFSTIALFLLVALFTCAKAKIPDPPGSFTVQTANNRTLRFMFLLPVRAWKYTHPSYPDVEKDVSTSPGLGSSDVSPPSPCASIQASSCDPPAPAPVFPPAPSPSSPPSPTPTPSPSPYSQPAPNPSPSSAATIDVPRNALNIALLVSSVILGVLGVLFM